TEFTLGKSLINLVRLAQQLRKLGLATSRVCRIVSGFHAKLKATPKFHKSQEILQVKAISVRQQGTTTTGSYQSRLTARSKAPAGFAGFPSCSPQFQYRMAAFTYLKSPFPF
ncbi:unnamed protein product, partial [Porites lobata]